MQQFGYESALKDCSLAVFATTAWPFTAPPAWLSGVVMPMGGSHANGWQSCQWVAVMPMGGSHAIGWQSCQWVAVMPWCFHVAVVSLTLGVADSPLASLSVAWASVYITSYRLVHCSSWQVMSPALQRILVQHLKPFWEL
jgi:hypothetical protein